MTVMLWLFSILEQNLRYITVGSESIFRQVLKSIISIKMIYLIGKAGMGYETFTIRAGQGI